MGDTPDTAGVGNSPTPAVRFLGVTKTFGAVTACDHIDLDLHRGEIHGILGENGAGKSTLMKILIGLEHPDRGRLEVDGDAAVMTSPVDAAARGIGMVHQHFSLVEPLTVWENVVLGERGSLDRDAARARVRHIGAHYGLEVDPDARVGELSAGLRQRVEIIKCLRRDPDILVFDEPTSVLTPEESEQLFSVLRLAVEREGKAVALVSHKLDEILHATDQVTILRKGRVVADMPTRDADKATLARAMVGREVSLRTEAAALGVVDLADRTVSTVNERTTVLAMWGASLTGRAGEPLLDRLDLEVHAGEIVGVAGVEGNGQVVLGEVLSSLTVLDEGRVEVAGGIVPAGRAGAMNEAGVAVIPEDRHDSGCVLEMSVAENLVMCHPEVVANRGFVDQHRLHELARSLIAEYEIQCSSVDAPMWSLSGGNQQRVVLARELSQNPKVLVAAQPTRGLDVGAIEFMSRKIREVADHGVGVLLISSEIEEILHLADRIVVLHRGRIVGEMTRDDVDLERLGLLMGGDEAA